MHPFSKIFIVVSAFILATTYMPTELSQGAIFEGTETESGVVFGVCLSDAARTDSKHPDYKECEDVNCDDSDLSGDDLVRCTSESAAGTDLAKTSLGESGITSTDDFGDFIIKLVNFSLPYLALAAFVGYVFAGFLYVTAYGNDEQLTKAKKILIWSSIGLLLVILSFSITQLLTRELVEGLGG